MTKRPDTQREMILQLWFAVIGTNGSGLVTRVEDITKWIGSHPQICPVEEVKKWIKSHPRICPLQERKKFFTRPVTVAVAAAVTIKVLDFLLGLVGVG